MTERCKQPNLVTENPVFDPYYDEMLGIYLDGGRSIVAYESLFRETRVTGTLNVYVWWERLQVTVERYDQPPIVLDLVGGGPNQATSLTVDALEKIIFFCPCPTTSSARGWFYLTLHWCKSC